MTTKALLTRSVKEFEDNVKNTIIYMCKRIVTNSGYVYLIKDESTAKQISCAIHWNASFETNDTLGKYESNEVSLNTREKLPFDCIIEYNDLVIAITSQDDYNATMGQWHYHGMASYSFINKRFFITSEEEIDSKIGINCMSLLLPLNLGYPVIPSFYSAQNHSQYIMVDVQSSEAITPVYRSQNEILQYRQDRVKVSFINLNTKEALEVVDKLQNYTLDSKNTRFAINDIISLRDENIYQKSFDWKSLTYVAEFGVNYYLKAQTDETQKQIRKAFFNGILVAI